MKTKVLREIERKFIVKPDLIGELKTGYKIEQGYIVNTPEKQVRVRIIGDRAELTIKGKRESAARLETNMDLDVVRARFLLNNFCEGSLIIKTRYMIPYKGYTWYVDEFNGDNLGLILAEVELRNEDEYFSKPSWIGKEVTNDERYYNHNLSSNPYKNWRDKV